MLFIFGLIMVILVGIIETYRRYQKEKSTEEIIPNPIRTWCLDEKLDIYMYLMRIEYSPQKTAIIRIVNSTVWGNEFGPEYRRIIKTKNIEGDKIEYIIMNDEKMILTS